MQITSLNQLLKKYKSEIENLEKEITVRKKRLNTVYEAIQLLQQEGGMQSALPSLSLKAESISEKYKGKKLNDAIFDVLSNSSSYLSGQEIFDEIIKNGFESASGDIRRDVYISLYRLIKGDKLIAKTIEGRKKYTMIKLVDAINKLLK
jgi:Fe2+ or Zn2+ uptake regulation protein